MNEKMGFHLSDEVAEPKGGKLYDRAALWVWVIGLVQAILFGCCGASVALMALIPIDQLRQIVTNKQQLEQITAAYPLLGSMALIVLLFGFLPGVVYLVLGFAVRRGRTLAVDAVLLLAITQCIVFGIVLLKNIAAAFASGGPASVTLNVLTLGSLLALLGHGIRCLWSVKQFGRENVEEADTDPWNDPQ